MLCLFSIPYVVSFHWPDLANRPRRLFQRFPFNFQLWTVNLFGKRKVRIAD